MTKKQLSIIDFFALESPFATEIRRLLVGIKRASKNTELKSILITSAVVSEGKSTICSFLAMTAAKRGMKTLMIDADLRRPSLHKNFAMARQNGLVEILADGAPTKSVIKKSGLEGLDIITVGRVVPHPAETFNPKSIGVLITEMKFYYDLILLDCAPVIPVSDPMLLAQEVDGVIMVIKAGETQRELVKRATEIIQSSTGNVIGVVLNNMTGSLPSYYDYSHYEYYAEPDSGRKRKAERPSSPKDDGSSRELKSPHTLPIESESKQRPISR